MIFNYQPIFNIYVSKLAFFIKMDTNFQNTELKKKTSSILKQKISIKFF